MKGRNLTNWRVCKTTHFENIDAIPSIKFAVQGELKDKFRQNLLASFGGRKVCYKNKKALGQFLSWDSENYNPCLIWFIPHKHQTEELW